MLNPKRNPGTLLMMCVIALFACMLIYGGVIGILHLREMGQPDYTGNFDEYPISFWLWQFFTPKANGVTVAETAEKVQATFAIMTGIGLVALLSTLYAMVVSKSAGEHN